MSALAQGTIIFDNRVPDADAPISLPNGMGAGSFPGMLAELNLVDSEGKLAPIAMTTFRAGSAQAAYFVIPMEITVPGLPGGAAATFRIRVFDGPSFENAQNYRGESIDVFVPKLGFRAISPGEHSPPVFESVRLAGLQPFTLVAIPEPGTLALFGVCGICLWVGRAVCERKAL